MKAEIKVESNKWIRVDLKDCARPRNVYHAPLSCGGFVCDVGRAIDQVMFDLELKVSDFEISPAYQWAFNRAISAFSK